MKNLIYNKENNQDKNVEIGKAKKKNILLIRSLLISVFIYYQNKNSNLMKFREESNKEKNL